MPLASRKQKNRDLWQQTNLLLLLLQGSSSQLCLIKLPRSLNQVARRMILVDLACHASTWLPTASEYVAFVIAELSYVVLYVVAAHCHASTYLLCSICGRRAELRYAVCDCCLLPCITRSHCQLIVCIQFAVSDAMHISIPCWCVQEYCLIWVLHANALVPYMCLEWPALAPKFMLTVWCHILACKQQVCLNKRSHQR